MIAQYVITGCLVRKHLSPLYYSLGEIIRIISEIQIRRPLLSLDPDYC